MSRSWEIEFAADEEIRKAVAAAIDAQSLIDVPFVSAAIADHLGAQPQTIKTQLAEAAVAARVAVFL